MFEFYLGINNSGPTYFIESSITDQTIYKFTFVIYFLIDCWIKSTRKKSSQIYMNRLSA